MNKQTPDGTGLSLRQQWAFVKRLTNEYHNLEQGTDNADNKLQEIYREEKNLSFMLRRLRKERPILFSTILVEAILSLRKTQTRRVISPQPIVDHDSGYVFDGHHPSKSSPYDIHNWKEAYVDNFSKWMPGDLLYVREEHYQYGWWGVIPGVQTKTGRQKYRFVPLTSEIKYFDNPPESFRASRRRSDIGQIGWHKRLARFMPKKAARIWLQVDDVRVERLQDISREDAAAEGILSDEIGFKDYMADASGYGDPSVDYPHVVDARLSFKSLWQKINGSESWDANPWVWPITFKVLSTTGRIAFEKESTG